MLRILKIIFCRHKEQKFLGTIHGDMINALNGARKEYECKRCGCRIFK